MGSSIGKIRIEEHICSDEESARPVACGVAEKISSRYNIHFYDELWFIYSHIKVKEGNFQKVNRIFTLLL